MLHFGRNSSETEENRGKEKEKLQSFHCIIGILENNKEEESNMRYSLPSSIFVENFAY